MDADGFAEVDAQSPTLAEIDDEFSSEEIEAYDSETCHTLEALRPLAVGDTETQAPSCQDEDSLCGSTVGEIPNDLDTCLAMNRAYQDILTDAIDKFTLSLEQNREMQATLPSLLSERAKASTSRLPSTPLSFFHPYFRDVSGMRAPPNEDEKIKRANKELDPYLRYPKPWTTEEVETLRSAVRTTVLQQALESCMNRKEILAEKLLAGRNPKLEEKVKEIESEIEEIQKMDIRGLLDKTGRPIDWMRVSAVDFEGLRSEFSCEMMWRHVVRPELNGERWTAEEDARLKELVKKWQGHNWEDVAKDLRSGRSAFQCARRYHAELTSRKRTGPFTQEEDELLSKLVEVCREGDYIPWRQVAYYMEHRSRLQLISRYERSMNPVRKRGRWTPEEDMLLLGAIKIHGAHDWNRLAATVPGRTAHNCRERYFNTYKDNLVFGPFTATEDRTLLDLVEKHGTKWATIAEEMPWRTDNMLLGRYKRLAKMLNLEGVEQIAEKKSLLPLERPLQRKQYTAEMRRESLTVIIQQRVMKWKQRQTARKVALNRDIERKEYLDLYQSLIQQQKARVARQRTQRSRASLLDSAIAKYLGRPLSWHPQGNAWKAYELEENTAILGVLRTAYDLPPARNPDWELGREPETVPLFAAHFRQKILGWESEMPSLPPPVLPPNMLTAATFNRLLDRVANIKQRKGFLDDSELAETLRARSASAVKCRLCRSGTRADGAVLTCLQCRRLRQIYGHYETLRGRFLSCFLWPAILGTQYVDKPKPERTGNKRRGKKRYGIARKNAKKPWVSEKWKKIREARLAAEAGAVDRTQSTAANDSGSEGHSQGRDFNGNLDAEDQNEAEDESQENSPHRDETQDPNSLQNHEQEGHQDEECAQVQIGEEEVYAQTHESDDVMEATVDVTPVM